MASCARRRVGVPVMSRVVLIALAIFAPVLGLGRACAADGPTFVIPGKAGVPVIVNGYGLDASYTIVEGEWGLDRPGVVTPTITYGPRVVPVLPPYRPFYPGFG